MATRTRASLHPLGRATPFLTLLVFLLTLPLPPASAALPVNAGQEVTNFYNERTGLVSNNVTLNGQVPISNGNDRDNGFRFPVNGVAARASFDVEVQYGYKWREQVHNNQGSWNTPGANFDNGNTTSLFGLRIDLNVASPFWPPDPADPADSVNVLANAYDVAAGDFDGDGKDDIAVLAGNTIQVRLNRGGNFQNLTAFTVTGTGFAMRSSDLNLDGRMDFVAVTTSGSITYLYPFIQTPSGTLRQEGPIPAITAAGSLPTDVAVADLSADGYPDVVVLYANRTVYWMNQFAGKNLDFWGADDYTVRQTSSTYTNQPNVVAAAPSPCNALVAVANANSNIYVYWQTNLTLVATLAGHTGAVNGLSWSPNCTYLASASTDYKVIVWRTSNWGQAADINAHTNFAYAVAFSPDSSLLASGGSDGQLKVWNLTALPPTLDYNVTDANGTIYALAFSPNSSYVAVGTSGRVVRMYQTSDYTLVANLTGYGLSVRSVAYSQDGSVLVTASDDDKLFVWNAANFTKRLERTNATGDLNRVSFAVDGTRLIAASLDGHAYIYRTSDWALTDNVTEGSLLLYGADFERTGERIFTGATGTTNALRLWDKSILLSIQRFQTRQNFTILGLAVASDGRIATAAEDGTVVVAWSSNGTTVARLTAHTGTANAVAWVPGAPYLLTAGGDSLVRVWDTATWNSVANLSVPGNVSTVDVSADGARIAAGTSSGVIRLWNTSGFGNFSSWNTPAAVSSVAFDPTGDFLVSGGDETTVRAWSAGSGTNVANLTGATLVVTSVDWSPDGTMIAAGGTDDRVRLYWTGNWTLRATMANHTGDVRAVAFSPNGAKLASGGLDGKVYTWAYDGTRLQNYTSAPAPSTLIFSIGWSPDSRRIAVGWMDMRFPVPSSSVCTICASIGSTGLAVGNVDLTAGNDVVITGHSGVTAGLWRLGFSGGSAGTWSTIVGVGADYTDAAKVAVGDLTGDGRNDIAVAGDTLTASTLHLVAFDSTVNAWNTTIQHLAMGPRVTRVLIADVSDDGHNDVVMTSAGGANLVQVAYYEEFGRPLGLIKIANISSIGTLAGGNAVGFAIGRFNNMSLNDTAVANGGANSVSIFRQKDTVDAYYVSAPLNDAQLAGFPVVAGYLRWDDFNTIANVTSYQASLSIDGGFSWTPVSANETLYFASTPGAQMQYRFDFHSERAAITAWILSLSANYLLETIPFKPRVDVARDFVNEWNKSGSFLGQEHVVFDAAIVNAYVLENLAFADLNGNVFVPILIRWDKPGIVRLTNLSIAYNLPAAVPVLKSPPDNAFADATPAFTFAANDTDADFLKYHIQIGGDPTFPPTSLEFDQNLSTNGWSRALYTAGSDAVFTLPDVNRLINGQPYWWRVRAYDGIQWGAWSPPWSFIVDDLAPDGAARTPEFSTVTSFLVTWSATDPPGGSGLNESPYDVQFKDGISGDWTDLYRGVNFTSTSFVGENGHTYCFRMRAADAAGNKQIYITSQTGDTCTTLDVDRPTASLVGLTPYQQSKTFAVAWSGNDGSLGSAVSSFDVDVMAEGGSFEHWLSSFSGTSATYSAAGDRLYSFRVAARDRAGNIGDWSAVVETRVDTSPPTGTVSTPVATTASLGILGVAYAFSDPETGVVAYEYIVGTGPGLADVLLPVRTTAVINLITNLNLENGGQYFVSVRALNAAGSWSPWVSSAGVRVLIPGPIATIEYPAGVWTLPNVTINLTAVDPLGYDVVAGELRFRRATFRYNALGTWELWFTLPVEAGATSHLFENLLRGYAYEFQYRARNEVASWGELVEGGTMFVNQIPVALAGPDRTAAAGEAVTLDATGTIDYDGDRDQLVYRWEADNGAVLNGATATVTFTDPGTHRVLLIVSDGHEETTATLHVYVPPPEEVPVLPGFDGLFALCAFAAIAAVTAARRGRREA